MKEHYVLIIVLATLFGRNLSTSDFSFSKVTSVKNREPRKHFSASACSFLGLGLRSRPQKSGFSFEKLFLGSLFSTSVTWEKLKSDVDKFFLRIANTIIRTKYYFKKHLLICNVCIRLRENKEILTSCNKRRK